MGKSARSGGDELSAITYELDPGETASEGVARAVAALSGQSVTPTRQENETLPPLFDVIDPEALDCLHERLDHGRSEIGQISFQYGGYEVTVRSNGPVTVRPDG